MFAIVVIAARRLPTAAFGIFSLASTLGWVLAVGTDFGVQLYFAREVARAPDRLSAILRPLLRLRVGLAAAGVGLAVPLGLFWVRPADLPAFVAIVSAYILGALVEFLNYGYRALSRSDVESTLNLVQRLAALTLALVLLVLVPGLTALAVALVAPAAVVLAWSLGITRRMAGHPSAAADAASSARLSWRTLRQDVLPIGAGIVLSALYFRVDVFFVEHWRGLEEVARYNAVFRLVDALRLFPAAILTVLLPAVFRRRDGAFIWRLSAGLTTLGLGIAGACIAAGPLLVRAAYGAQYAPAIGMLRVLLLAFPLLSLNYGLTHQLIGWGAQRAYTLICAGALVVNIAVNVALVPAFGGLGAAWATVATEVVLTIALVSALAAVRSRASSWPAPSAIPTALDPADPAPPRAGRP